MDQQQQELAKAWEELCFWRDFARWSHQRHLNGTEPRVIEAILRAERRYIRAGKSHTESESG